MSLKNEIIQYCIHKYRLCLHFQAFQAVGMKGKLTEINVKNRFDKW